MNPGIHSPFPLGTPRSKVTTRPVPAPSLSQADPVAAAPRPSPEPERTSFGRAPEWGCPRPKLSPQPLTPAEGARFFDAAPQNADDVAPERTSVLAEGLTNLPNKVEPAVRALLAIGCGSILLVLGVQLTSFAVTLRALPLGVQIVGGLAAAVLVVVVGHGLFTLAREFSRLRQSPRISLQALRELDARAATRHTTLSRTREAARRVREFLETYPRDDPTRSRHLVLGMTAAEWDDLDSHRVRLLEGQCGDERTWLDEVDRRFLGTLDVVARRLIRSTALRTGLKTVATPTGFLDAALVAAASVGLVRDLCRLYHLRTDRWGTLLVLAHVVGNIVVSSQTEELLQDSGESLGDWLQEAMGALAGNVTRFAGTRIAEGMSNTVLVIRLGHVAVKLLRPLTVDR